jgi:DUF1365 family protein
MAPCHQQEVLTMTKANAWSEISQRLEALGLKLKLHFEQTRDEEVADAVGRLRRDIEDAFEAAGNAVKDEAVRTDAREVGLLFADAVAATLEKFGSEIRNAANRRS